MVSEEILFTGVGELEQPYHIELRDDVQPVIQATRKLPYTRMDKLKRGLLPVSNHATLLYSIYCLNEA